MCRAYRQSRLSRTTGGSTAPAPHVKLPDGGWSHADTHQPRPRNSHFIRANVGQRNELPHAVELVHWVLTPVGRHIRKIKILHRADSRRLQVRGKRPTQPHRQSPGRIAYSGRDPPALNRGCFLHPLRRSPVLGVLRSFCSTCSCFGPARHNSVDKIRGGDAVNPVRSRHWQSWRGT